MGCEGDQEMESLSCKMRLRKCDIFGLIKPQRGYDFSFIFLSVLGKGREGIREAEELFKLRDMARTSTNECKLALDKFGLEERAFKTEPSIQVVWRGQEILKRGSYQQNWHDTVALNSKRLHTVTQIVHSDPMPIFLLN